MKTSELQRISSFLEWLRKVLKNLMVLVLVLGLTEVSDCSQLKAAQVSDINVTGTVTDRDGAPLPGVNVYEKGNPAKGTVTGPEGVYSLTLPQDAILVFSYVGFLTREIPVQGRTTIDVTLEQDITGLEEIVVIGYGTVKKSDLTGSVSVVNTDDIKNAPLPGIDQYIQGKAAGVAVTRNGGSPGAGVVVRVRGTSTFGNSQPLYVIDGLPRLGTTSGNNPLNEINPQDIESIEVLKDASATAIYGAQGANGVIMITTKKGSIGKPVINFSSQVGVSQSAKTIEMMNTWEYAQFYNMTIPEGDYFLLDSANQEVQLNPDYIVNEEDEPYVIIGDTDWMDEVMGTGILQNYQLSVSGGTEKTRYFLSGSYYDETGILVNSFFKRYQLRSNVESQITDRLTVGNNLNLTRTYQNNYGGPQWEILLNNTFPMVPVLEPYDREGNFNGAWNGGLPIQRNPLGLALRGYHDNILYSVTDNFYAELELPFSITYRLNASVYFRNQFLRDFVPDYREGLYGSVPQAGDAVTERDSRYTLRGLLENTLNFSREFGRNSITILAGISTDASNYERVDVRGLGQTHPSLDQIGSVITSSPSDSHIEEHRLQSYLGRLMYSFDDKYYFTGSIRRDGSSRFGPNNQYGNFPSFALKWRVSREGFMQNFESISDLSIRAGYGQTGNQSIGDYGFIPNLDKAYYPDADGNLMVGFYPETLTNADLRWEATEMSNIGFDLYLFDNQLNVVFDAYKKSTDGMLLVFPLPASGGYNDNPYRNIGIIENKGFEGIINYKRIWSEWSVETSVNFSFNRNEMVDLEGLPPFFGGGPEGGQELTVVTEGYPVGSFYGYVSDGLYQTLEEVLMGPQLANETGPGDIKYIDVNGDNRISDDDRKPIGNPHPLWVGGLNTRFTYKNFSLSVNLTAEFDKEIYNRNWPRLNVYDGQTGAVWNYSKYFWENYYRAPVYDGDGNVIDPGYTDTDVPRIQPGYSLNILNSDYYIEDGSYVRISNVTLGYTFSNEMISRLKLSSARAYVSVRNLYTFTGYSGFDPEIGQNPLSHSTLSYGIDNGIYPIPRTFVFGIDFSF